MKKILLIGVYGMEIVECGGALLKNVLNGGKSFATIMLASEETKEQLLEASKILKTDIDFLNSKMGEIHPTTKQKLPLIQYIRKIKPDIIITQDTEHCISDLDPDRRMAMTLILESIALSSRNFMVDEYPPCPIGEIYYMTPNNPNCIVNISDVWEEKQNALDCLKSQLEFSGQHYQNYYGDKIMQNIIPEWNSLNSNYEKGKKAMRAFNYAYYLNNGSLHHGHFAFSEAYRKEGIFHLDSL